MTADVEQLLRDSLERLTEQVEVPADLPARAEAAAARRPRGWPLAVPPAVTLLVGLWGATARPYWGDEVDTLSATARSLPQLTRLLQHVDAVHGLYYLLLWAVTRAMGMGVFATRLPSVLAMAAAAFGVAVIGRRLRSARAGVYAGLVFAALPVVAQQAHDARPYALVTAAAVLSSYLLLRVAADPRPGWFACYGGSLLLLGYLELFSLLIVPAHAVTLWMLSRRQELNAPGHAPARDHGTRLCVVVARRWLVTAAAAGVGVTPVVVWGWRERAAIAWIRPPGWSDLAYLTCWLAAGSGASAGLLALLGLAGWRHGDAAPMTPYPALTVLRWPGRALSRSVSLAPRLCRGGSALAWLALPWLVVPPLALIAASGVTPVYSFRYIVFCLPAVALLAGGGLAALGGPVRVSALALVVALAAPAQLALRVPGSGYDGGVHAAAEVLAAYERPGDAIIYPSGGIPPWALAYPGAFGRLRDISLAHSAAALGHLYSSRAPAVTVVGRERGVNRVWVAESGTRWQDPGAYLAPGFRLVRRWQPGHSQTWLALYQRRDRPRRQ